MNSFCPSCALTVEVAVTAAEGRRRFSCPRCRAVLKEEVDKPEKVLGRVPLARVTTADVLAAREAEAARKQQIQAEAAQRTAARQARAAAEAPASKEPAAIDLPDFEGEEFVIEAAGSERAIPTGAPAKADPATRREPAAAAQACVVLAESAGLAGSALAGALARAGIELEVKGCLTGDAVLETVAGRLASRRRVLLAVLDVDLPVLNGFQAAIALRALERGLGAPTPTPILFFTAYECDSVLQKVLDYCQPARFLSRASDAPGQAAQRLAQLVASMQR